MHHLLYGSRFVGSGYVKGYEMLDLGDYPGVVHGRGVVYGEVYEVEEDETLEQLDDAEGVDEGLYTRVSDKVFFGEELSEEAQLYLYSKPSRGFRKIEEGDWARYRGRSRITNLFISYNSPMLGRYRPIRVIQAKLGEINGVIYTIYVDTLDNAGELRVCKVKGLHDGKTYYALSSG